MVLLLVDAEGPVEHSPCTHLRQRDGWETRFASESAVHLMTQTMEAWLVADADALADYYGQGFLANALPVARDLEFVPKRNIARALTQATRATGKGSYQKIHHASQLLGSDRSRTCSRALRRIRPAPICSDPNTERRLAAVEQQASRNAVQLLGAETSQRGVDARSARDHLDLLGGGRCLRAGRPAHHRVDYTRVMSASDYQYSMVVDWLGSHPYQAEVLLFTLEAFANVPRRQMVVQCTDRVSDDVIAKLSAQGYTVTTIAPYLDQAYCNKIAQLDYFVDSTDARGVFLLDLDLAILAELDIPDRDVVCGKLVDGANPPLDTLRAAVRCCRYRIAGDHAERLGRPWRHNRHQPERRLSLRASQAYIEPLRNKWRHWAEFLFAKPDLFDHPSARKHIDQIAFAMALASARIPFRHLPTNWNYPGHKDRVPRAYRRDEPLRVLHYHDRVGRFGLIDAAEFDGAAVADAVHRVNSALAARDEPIPVL